MAPIEYHDIPWDALLEQAEDTMRAGATVYQKFTCSTCGTRQVMDTPNKFYTEGKCEECGRITDLVKKGGGFMATFDTNE